EYDVPDDLDLRAETRWLAPPSPDGSAKLRIRQGAGWGLRRRATATEDLGDGWDRVDVPYGGRWQAAEEIASYGPDVVVLEPAELRDAVVSLLRGVAGDAA